MPLSSEQKESCDELLGFVVMCRISYEEFREALIDRMPEKTEEEIFYLLGSAQQLYDCGECVFIDAHDGTGQCYQCGKTRAQHL